MQAHLCAVSHSVSQPASQPASQPPSYHCRLGCAHCTEASLHVTLLLVLHDEEKGHMQTPLCAARQPASHQSVSQPVSHSNSPCPTALFARASPFCKSANFIRLTGLCNQQAATAAQRGFSHKGPCLLTCHRRVSAPV
jgi:hypothetical protein